MTDDHRSSEDRASARGRGAPGSRTENAPEVRPEEAPEVGASSVVSPEAAPGVGPSDGGGRPPARQAPGTREETDVRRLTGSETRFSRERPFAGSRAPKRTTLDGRQRHAAQLDARGTPVETICRTIPTTRSALHRWRKLPAYQEAVRAERAAIAVSVESELMVGRLEAVRRLRILMLKPEGVDPGEQSAAARAVLAASAPPGEVARARARREILGALPPALRAQVAEHLDGAVESELDGMTDDELRAIAGVASTRVDTRGRGRP